MTVGHEMQNQAGQKSEYQRKGRLDNKPQHTSERITSGNAASKESGLYIEDLVPNGVFQLIPKY